MPFLTAGGHRLHYEWIGPAPEHAPTLVFLHHGLGAVSTWLDLPARLSEATGCGALVYSRQGYGKSAPVQGTRPFRYLHDEALKVLPEVLAETGVRQTILIGHSDGGTIALLYAGAAPGRSAVQGVVSIAAHVIYEEISWASVRAAKKSYATTDMRAKLARHHDDVDGAFCAWADMWDNPDCLAWSTVEHLPGIACPVLAIQGTEDEYGTRRQVALIVERTSGGVRAMILDKCGHTPHQEQTETVVDAIVRLVRDALARAA